MSMFGEFILNGFSDLVVIMVVSVRLYCMIVTLQGNGVRKFFVMQLHSVCFLKWVQ